MRLILLAGALSLLVVPLAGCIGGTDKPVEKTSEPVTTPEEAQQKVEDAKKNVTGNASGPTKIKTDPISGTATTAGAGPGASAAPDETPVMVDVAKGVVKFQIKLTASNALPTGGELQLLIAEPGCDFNTGCEESVVSSGGVIDWTAKKPLDGSYTIRFFGTAPGVSQMSYEGQAIQTIPA
jgi:hypothetical protein